MGVSMNLGSLLGGELHQIGFDEVIDLPVHHSSDIGGLVACTVVLHTTIIEDIASYLCTPFDLLLACFDFGLCPTPALELLVVELFYFSREDNT